MLCEDSVGKGCLAIPQEVGGLPEMVVLQNTAGLTRSLCRRESGGKGCCRREKAKWTAAGAGEEVGFLYCVGVRPDGVAGWRPLHFSAQRGH